MSEKSYKYASIWSKEIKNILSVGEDTDIVPGFVNENIYYAQHDLEAGEYRQIVDNIQEGFNLLKIYEQDNMVFNLPALCLECMYRGFEVHILPFQYLEEIYYLSIGCRQQDEFFVLGNSDKKILISYIRNDALACNIKNKYAYNLHLHSIINNEDDEDSNVELSEMRNEVFNMLIEKIDFPIHEIESLYF